MKKVSTVILLIFFVLTACTTSKQNGDISWFTHPKQNDGSNLYGVAEGFTLAEATKAALVDAASRLMVTISSESTLLSEENKTGVNEEMRRKISQNIEKIDFTNYKVSRSENLNQNQSGKFYVEVQIDRSGFIDDQKKSLQGLEGQVFGLDITSRSKNILSRRNALVRIVELEKIIELKSRILEGLSVDVNLDRKIITAAEFKTLLSLFNDKIEFYFDINSPVAITNVIRNALNKEQIKIARSINPENKNQIIISVDAEEKSLKLDISYMTKIRIDFKNIVEGKIVASNVIEANGASTIDEKEAHAAAMKDLEDIINKNGIMKILGIIQQSSN